MGRKFIQLALFLLFASTIVCAQIRPMYDQGALGLAQLLKRLNTTASVLMIGAHPDDEDTALLAYLARGENARTAYLSLTRGDGGQNIIGPELGEALGVIRTEELLQARKLDGAEQYFTRAYDFGFSKTLDEAKSKWDEKVVLCDVVRVIRSYRPLVVVSVFTGTPLDGHGQHQFAGYIAPIAVKAAADPGQCADSGSAWNVKKFYIRHRGDGQPTLRINTGRYDPLYGRSYFEIAMQARSQHRSQEQGVLELKGAQFSNLNLVGAPTGTKESGIFEGLDRSSGSANLDLSNYDPSMPELLIKRLSDAFEKSPDFSRQYLLSEALLRAAGIQIQVLADRATTVSGESVPISVRVFSNFSPVTLKSVSFNLPFEKSAEPTSTQPAFRRETANISEYFKLTIPKDVSPTQPYWLRGGRRGDLFALPSGASASTPFEVADAPIANITLDIAGRTIKFATPVEYRFADDIRGEIRRDLNIVPKLAVGFEQELMVVPMQNSRRTAEVVVAVTNNSDAPINGKVALTLPQGWTSAPTDFSMSRKGETTPVRLPVTIPPGAQTGSYQIKAEATANGETFSQTMQVLAYEHIQTHRIYRPSNAVLKLIDVQTAPVRVGYIRGSGDRVPDAIKQLGFSFSEIDERTLASGDLSKFDTIVVGIRAYQVREDIVANNQRLLDFAKNGGTLIVQYQLPQTYAQRNLTPFPAQMGPRVVDEDATVTILEPQHPLFNFPNKIGPADFEGWVQERNLYNFSTMDPKYVGLLESHDAGEPENKGGLVVADIGKGRFIFCSYSLFRQLPAGVPGAYRLLANMLSLPKAAR